MAGTPYPEVTGLICRIPLARVCRHALVFLTRGTCVGSWYGSLVPFSRVPGVARLTPLHVTPFLTITVLQGASMFRQPDKTARVGPKRQFYYKQVQEY
jgi:hypothetical protein